MSRHHSILSRFLISQIQKPFIHKAEDKSKSLAKINYEVLMEHRLK